MSNKKFHSRFYYICCKAWSFFFVVFFRREVYGLENFPEEGGCILAVNHTSYFDPFIAGSACPREIYYLARKSLFKNKLVSKILRSWNSVPIVRGGYNADVFRTVLGLVDQGGVVLIFPEGTRSPDGKLQKIHRGIGYLAEKAKTDILPCYISGAWDILPRGSKWVRFKKVKLVFGKPITYAEMKAIGSKKSDFEKIADILSGRFHDLKNSLEKV